MLRYSLKAGGQNIPTAVCMGLCSPVPKGTAGYDGGGATEVPAAGTQRAFDVASHLPVLGGLWMSLDLTMLVPPTLILFVLQGCCLDGSWGFVLFVRDFQLCAILTHGEIRWLCHMSSYSGSFLGFASKLECPQFMQVWLCNAYRASLMLYRKCQAYVACTVVEVWRQIKE